MSKACPDLLGTGRRKDRSANTGSEQPPADIASKCGLMAGSTATYHRDLVLCRGYRFWMAVDDLVGFVELEGRICKGQGAEGRDDCMCRIVDEVFG